MPIYTSELIGKKLSVVDEMLLLQPHVIPMISLLGFGPETGNTNHEWNEDSMFGFQSVLAAGMLSTGGCTVADGSMFRIGHVIRIDDEMCLVSNIATNVLTITRGYAGTTAATHDSGAQVEICFTEGVEGANARAARYKQRVNKFNYTQIFDDTVEVTGTAQAIDQYGMDNLIETEKQKKVIELSLQLEKALINGQRYRAGNTSQMGGLRYWLTSNVSNGSGNDISSRILNDMVQSVIDAGGFATGGNYKFVSSTMQKRKISTLNDGKLVIPRSDNVTGVNVNQILTDFGQFDVVTNANLRPDELYFIDINRMTVKPLKGRNWFFTYMGPSGDKTTGTLVGEFTFELLQQEAHARAFNLKKTW